MQKHPVRKRMTPRERKLQQRRRQRQQRLMIALCTLFSLALLIAVVATIKVPATQTTPNDAWIVADGAVEIAAPPLDSGYGTLDIVEEYTAPTVVPFVIQETPQPRSDIFDEPSQGGLPDLEPLPTMAPETVSITISAAGDCTLGGDTQSRGFKRFVNAVNEHGYEFFLANVKSIFENDDITIVNLEGPLTTSTDARSGRKFLFKGNPGNVEILTSASVEVCNVANNHAKDFGKAGQQETLEVLEAAGIGSSGYSKVCFQEVRGVRVGFLGLTEWDYSLDEVRARVRDMRGQCDLLIVSIHWGEEGNYSATSTQKKYGHAIIDEGADLVLGHHPHVIGGVEQYEGKYIVYSLGNFCFGGNGNPSDKDTMIFRQRFNVTLNGEVQDGGAEIIPCSVSSVKNSNNFQPTPLTDEAYTRLMKKISNYSDANAPVIAALRADF